METCDWVSVGALGEAFSPGSHGLEPVAELAGRRLTVHFEDGDEECYRFLDDRHLLRQRPDAGGEMPAEEYRATSLRPGIYFIDFLEAGRRASSRSLVLDLGQGVVTAVTGTLPTRQEAMEPLLARIARGEPLSGVSAAFSRGTIDRPCAPDAPLHPETTELVGRRVRYVYSSTESYEHLYLNPGFYTWHCLTGVEKGLCDTDRCHTYRIAEALYLFVWREKIVPTLGVVMIDLEKMKTTGKIFGYCGDDFGALTNFGIGALAAIVNIVPPGFRP